MRRLLLVAITIIALMQSGQYSEHSKHARSPEYSRLDTSQDLGIWEGWGSSLAWWGHAVGGTQNVDYYADLTTQPKKRMVFPAWG